MNEFYVFIFNPLTYVSFSQATVSIKISVFLICFVVFICLVQYLKTIICLIKKRLFLPLFVWNDDDNYIF